MSNSYHDYSETANARENERGVHLRHCYQDEYETTCKYGDKECPARKVTRKVERPRHPLDTLSVHDLSALRAIILTVIDDGCEGQSWLLDHANKEFEHLVNAQRLDFCNEIEQRIIAAAVPSVSVKGAITNANLD